MPHVSRKKLDKKILDRILDFLVVALTDIKDEKEMRAFLDSFFTSTEKIMLAKRLGIVYLLKEGLAINEISETLSVGKPTIERMKMWLKTEGSGYEVAIDTLRRTKKLDDFKNLLKGILKEFTKPPYTGILKQPYAE